MLPEKINPHLALVDDDPEVQDLISAFFKPKGYTISIYPEAEIALAQNQELVKWDLLITDLRLPHMSGIEFIEKIKKIRPELPIILITVMKSVENALKASAAGANDFIVKPIHFAQLQVSVEKALHFRTLPHNFPNPELKEKTTATGAPVVGSSPKFVAVLAAAKKVAKSSSNIILTGESGTGKEVFARIIHEESRRKKGPFVAINCSAIPEDLLESELFGHAKGAFTGAHDKKIGLFEEAENGTLFLDEIGDMNITLQAKLLRVLQEKRIKRLGENQTRMINARIISATHKNLIQEVNDGKFREDLFYRLSVIPLHLPPLRERAEDIIPLAQAFLKRFAHINNSPARNFSQQAIDFFQDYAWPGNVRELENAIERAVVLATKPQVEREDLMMSETDLLVQLPSPDEMPINSQDFSVPFTGRFLTVQEMIQRYIEYAVAKNHGARDKTAKELGIDRKTLYKRMRPLQNAI